MRALLFILSFICISMFAQSAGRCNAVSEEMSAVEKAGSNNSPYLSIPTVSNGGEIELAGIQPVPGNVQCVTVTRAVADSYLNCKERPYLRSSITFLEPAVFKFAGTHFLRLIYPSHYFW